MNKDLINIPSIKTELYSIFKGTVSSNVFTTNLPKTIQESWKDMVVIDCSNAINDFDAYGYGTVLIRLYAKPMSNGSENIPTLKKMGMAFNDVLSNYVGKYSLRRRFTYSDYDANRNLHSDIIELQILTA